MQFTERHSALVEHCLPTVTGGGYFYNYLDSDELTKKNSGRSILEGTVVIDWLRCPQVVFVHRRENGRYSIEIIKVFGDRRCESSVPSVTGPLLK